MTDPAVPSDTSLVPVLDIFVADGWEANHVTHPDATMKCGECHELSPASELRAEAVHRIEGASDPEDMQTVMGIECPRCGAKGALVAAHGPAASAQADEFLAAVDLGDEHDPVAAD